MYDPYNVNGADADTDTVTDTDMDRSKSALKRGMCLHSLPHALLSAHVKDQLVHGSITKSGLKFIMKTYTPI